MSDKSLCFLLSCGDAADAVGVGPPSAGLLVVAGRPVIERQVRQAVQAGARRILVLAEAIPHALSERLQRYCEVALVTDRARLASELASIDGGLMLLQPGLVVDERLIEAVRDAPDPACLLVRGDGGEAGALRLDSARLWAGIARLPAAGAARLLASHPSDWEPIELLVRGALAEGAGSLDMADQPTYAPTRRREVPFVWEAVDRTGQAQANDALIASAQKGVLDWPARFLHPPIENGLVRLLWPTPITPNMVTLGTAVLGFVAMALLALGHLWPGLILILIVGPLDGADGKLARTRCEFSRWGDLEHVLDKVLEYGWFLALALHFWLTGHGAAAWLIAIGTSIFTLTESILGEYFRRFSGRQLDDWGPFERRFRLIAGRRNTFFWTLVPFAALGLWWEGFLFLFLYAAVTFGIAQWRFLLGIAAFGRAHSTEVASNFTKSSYGFLPQPSAKSS